MKTLFQKALGMSVAGALMATASMAMAETTVSMWTFLDPAKEGGRDVALRQMIESFEAANPDIKIKVEPQVWTTLAEKFVLGNNAGNAPDIGWVNAENLGLVLNSDAAADLKALVVDKWDASRRDDMVIPKSLEAVTADGKTQAMPIMAITWVMMYRKDLFDAAGLDASDISTWDGVTAAARKLTKDTNGDGTPDVYGIALGLAQERFSATPAALAAYQANGGFFGEDCKAQLDSDGTAKAIQMQADWIKDGLTSSEAPAMTSDDAIEQFTAGRYAMAIIANSRFERIQANASGWDPKALGVAPIPSVTDGEMGPHLVTGWFAAISQSSDNKEAAAKFVDHMTGPESAALWNIPGGQVPMMKSVAARDEMKAPEFAHLPVVAGLMQSAGEFVPGKCTWSRTFADFNLATQKVVLGQADAKSAVAEIQSSTQARQ